MKYNTTKTLTAIARDNDIHVGSLHHVWTGVRPGTWLLYVALRKAGWPLSPDTIAFEKKAKRVHDKRAK